LFWILHPEESALLTDPAGYQAEHGCIFSKDEFIRLKFSFGGDDCDR
jgi:hypothetical protein